MDWRDAYKEYPHMFSGGISLRDWFAGQAFQLQSGRYKSGVVYNDEIDVLARNSYRIADAMLRAREE